MTAESAADDEPFQKLLAELLEAVERGEVIDREQLSREHPPYADSICDFLDNNALVDDAIRVLRDSGAVSPVDSAFAATLDSQATQQPRPFSIGDHLKYIGEYELLDEIARGGMGVVFKARQIELR
ncbi:hypothetical protein [Aporhodopirellula aestuarii]|uniref:Serine/threonine protein kinase n=1 Tax=Aporhodopirellula aestuarii TaxID=2950107 RepID=A0ABT0U5X4_9BACT|nr:hypothetical protein [Aporhodopirellula aestuarii]MCM2372334.1 hypothetical protein [Aporhodopirellula aestuarii]